MNPPNFLNADHLLLSTDHQVISNKLAQYAAAMDQQDPDAAGLLLAHARLHFKDQPPYDGAEEITRFYTTVFPSSAPTRHIVSNLVVTSRDDSATYQAYYQRWSLAEPHQPHCESIGGYYGHFTRTNSALRWADHHVLAK
ncbi:nuclear transport factor 2 family protein [Corynebacterium sp. A21]|uniref:nuclear transport factor 2 family protein n=1 Tax=Corynebacterium sp. A21 TaxID=3457318 RepID=UPI003FD4A03D